MGVVGEFVKYFFIGGGIGLLLMVVIVPIYKWFKNMGEKKQVHKAIINGQFLKPLDKRDYDYAAWQEKRNLPIPTEEDLIPLQELSEKMKKINFSRGMTHEIK